MVQAALVALPARLPPLPWGLDELSNRWWAIVPAGSVVVVIAAIDAYEESASVLTWSALFAVPPAAAFALARLVRGADLRLAVLAVGLFAIAWACAGGSLAGETAATLLSALACVTFGWLLVSVVPAQWLRWGIYAMAAIDAVLVAGDLLQGPNSVLVTAAPGADLPRLQVAAFGSARMGFGDLFVAALVGCLLAPRPGGEERSDRRQLACAALTAVLVLCFDLLFFAVDELPATVPVAVALAIAMRLPSGAGQAPARAQL